MERLKKIKDTLLCEIESQLCGNLALVDTKELGEVVDMVKDLSETMYYCSVAEAMERPYYFDYPRYYTEHRAMEVSHHNGKEGYDEHKDMSLADLIIVADDLMYESKNEYYKKTGKRKRD